MEVVAGKLLFVPPGGVGRSVQLAAGTFKVVRERGMILLTYPCIRGTLTHETAKLFQADDGRTWRVDHLDVTNDQTRFILPDNFPNGTV